MATASDCHSSIVICNHRRVCGLTRHLPHLLLTACRRERSVPTSVSLSRHERVQRGGRGGPSAEASFLAVAEAPVMAKKTESVRDAK